MKRSLILIGSAVVAMSLPLTAPGQAAKGQVQITWHGQSFFEVKSSKGTNIVVDPHNISEYGRVLGVKADAVLMSHNHNDHTQVEVIQNIKDKGVRIIPGLKGVGARITWNPVDEQVKDVHIRSVGVYHDDEQGLKHGKNTVFILDLDGWKIVHLGDLGHLLTPVQLRNIGPVDVLMIPVGGVYTLNGSEAKQVVDQIKPREYILPMHYGTAVYSDLLTVNEFREEFPRANVATATTNTLVLNRDKERPRPLLAILHWWPGKKRNPKDEG
jgi:L-ascorbate metabolism protein UlaG (beta-lactamase superfamily)